MSKNIEIGKLKSEILTLPLSEKQLVEELKFFEIYFTKLGYKYCEILFGAFWGNYYYLNNWNYEKILIKEIPDKIQLLKNKKAGNLGTDDLFIKVTGFPIEFLFCNDSDIHILYDESSQLTEYFYNRWKSLGFSPAEWEKDNTGKPIKCLRTN